MISEISAFKELGGLVVVILGVMYLSYLCFNILMQKVIEPLTKRHIDFLDKVEKALDSFSSTLEHIKEDYESVKAEVSKIDLKLNNLLNDLNKK